MYSLVIIINNTTFKKNFANRIDVKHAHQISK